jgi:fatty acyl-CoA reductase
MVHVSTAFNNLDKFEIDEVIYPGKMDPVKLSEFIDDANSELIDEITLE